MINDKTYEYAFTTSNEEIEIDFHRKRRRNKTRYSIFYTEEMSYHIKEPAKFDSLQVTWEHFIIKLMGLGTLL